RQDVAAQNVPMRCSESLGGPDKISLFCTESYAANQARRSSPPEDADRDHDNQECPKRGNQQRQKRADTEKKVEPRQSKAQFGRGEEEGGRPTPKIPRRAPGKRADQKKNRGGQQAGKK